MEMAFPHCDIRDLEGLLWTHVALLSLCAILILASFNSQFKDAAPYGRHADPEKVKAWGFQVPQRIAHTVSDGFPGIPFPLAVYLLYTGLLPPANGGSFSAVRAINVVLLCGWLLHYLYRGIVHPLIMPYSSKTVAIGISLAGIFPNMLFSYLIAAQLACTVYPDNWASQPRFIIGVVLYGVGTVINRWADLKMRAGRLALRRRDAAARAGSSPQGGSGGGGGAAATAASDVPNMSISTARESLLGAGRGDGDGDGDGEAETDGGRTEADAGKSPQAQSSGVRQQYFIPYGGLYELVSCPNYLGELIEWIGYALALWSWPALAWALFCASTFIPRSLTNHRWYKQHFGDEYPSNRKALIPFFL